MKDKQFCFIICTNNDVLLQECVNYINRLYVPEGYEYDIISVKEANSMTSGYNAAMRSSDAKYKIYMHQDVFIINRYFLHDLLTIFDSDPSVGLIGLVGYKSINGIGVMWNEERFGMVPMYGVSDYYKDFNIEEYRYCPTDGYYIAQVADGLLMATAYDVEWDEEFDAWDFYDASQSIRFQKAGYKLVIPKQTLPWVIHDDGRYLNLSKYNKYRKMFLNKYVDIAVGNYRINILFVYSDRDKIGKCLLNKIQSALSGDINAEIINVNEEQQLPHTVFRKIQASKADIIIDINAAGRIFRTELNNMSYTILGKKIAFIVNDDSINNAFFEETFNLSHFLSIESEAIYKLCKEEMIHIPNLYNTSFQTDKDIIKWFELMKKEMELG